MAGVRKKPLRRKPRKTPNIKTGTSRSYRVSATKFISQSRTRAAVEAYLGSDYFADAMAHMDAYDRLLVVKCATRMLIKVGAVAPLADPVSRPRLRRWSDALHEQFNATVYRHLGKPDVPHLDEAIAKDLGWPLSRVTPARWRLIGPIGPPRGPRRKRPASPAAPSHASAVP